MKLRTTYGHDFNCSRIWGIEWGSVCEYDYHIYKKGDIHWSSWSNYTSQRRMLQGLKNLREKEKNSKYHYRPVHIDYSHHLEHLDTDSKRRYNLSKLL